MADEMRSGGVTQQSQHDELRYQQLELKNALPLNIYLGMEYASAIQSSMVFGNTIKPTTTKGFYQVFWHIYHYVKNSVDAERLNPGLTNIIDKWFDVMSGQSRNTKLILMGVDLYIEFVKNMQEWGIGRLFEKGIDPPFMLEDLDDFDLLTEEIDEEVIAGVDEDAPM
jgi:hypothetical protein